MGAITMKLVIFEGDVSWLLMMNFIFLHWVL